MDTARHFESPINHSPKGFWRPNLHVLQTAFLRVYLVTTVFVSAFTLGTPGLAQESAPAPEKSDLTETPLTSQAELLQALVDRIAQLEAREAERIDAGKKAKENEERVAALLANIRDLEGKVASIEDGRVLPEIVLPATDEPTVHDLDQRIAELATQQAAAEETARTQAAAANRITAGPKGFAIASPDNDFRLRLRAMVQADSQTFFDDNPLNQGNDTFSLRRARFSIEGTAFKDFDFRVVPQYGGFANGVQILDADIKYRFRPELQFQAGKFKGPVGLEVLQPIAAMPLPERSSVSGLVPLRNIGFQVLGDIADGTVRHAAGVFNNAGDGRNTGNVNFTDDNEYAGRLFFRPFKRSGPEPLRGFGFGVGGSYSQVFSNAFGLPASFNNSLPGYYTAPAFQQFFAYNPLAGPVVADGSHWRIAPQGYYYFGPFGLMGAYVISTQDVCNSATFRSATLSHTGWQLTADWVLTGEKSSYSGITPKRPFSLKEGGWGAWQIAFRYSQMNMDPEAFQGFSNPQLSASGASSYSLGVNWWLNQYARLLTSFTHTAFEGGGAGLNLSDPGTWVPPATVTHQDENVFSARLQLSF